MNLVFINNGYFFKYITLDTKEFSFYANGFDDDIKFEILNHNDNEVELKMFYNVFTYENELMISSGFYQKDIITESTIIKLKLNRTAKIPYTILSYDFNNGFINKPHDISISFLEEKNINLKRANDEFGNEYVGGVLDGLKNGFGEFTYATKTKYIGEFKNNIREGLGTLVSAHEMYVGEFKGDAKCGLGTVYYTDGSKYYGYFMSDKTCGLGIFKYKDGTYEIAKYFNDCLVGDENKDKRAYIRFKEEDLVTDTSIILNEGVTALNDTLAIKINKVLDDSLSFSLIYMEVDDNKKEIVKEESYTIKKLEWFKTNYSYIYDHNNKSGYFIISYMDESLKTGIDNYRYFLSNGGIFDGEMDGKYPKKGHLYISDNEYYDGEFYNEKLDGDGVYHMPDGDTIKGKFLEDVPEGIVEYTYPTGAVEKRKYFSFAYPRSNGVDMYKDLEE